MSELKCPYCNKPLVDRGYYDYMCPDECDGAGNIVGNESMWQELIDTKKKLDVAVKALKWIDETYKLGQELETDIWAKCQYALERIKDKED